VTDQVNIEQETTNKPANTASSTLPGCFRHPTSSALAALGTICRHYGLPSTLRIMRRLTGFDRQNLNGVQFVFAAARCGFQATPLEGEFEQLVEVPLPAIVIFAGSQYQVLFDVSENFALVGDTATGEVSQLTREQFLAGWTGEVFEVLPTDGLGAVRNALRRSENGWSKLAAALGVIPLAPPRILFVTILSTWVFCLSKAPVLALLSATGLLVSLWIAAYPEVCSRCSVTSSLVGSLPLAWSGSVFYAGITVASLLGARHAVSLALLAASGIHATLVVALLRRRTACYPCIIAAAVAWLAAGFAWNGIVWEILLLPGGAVLGVIAIFVAKRLTWYQSEDQVVAIAEGVASQAFDQARARLVIYGLKNCPYCVFFKTVVRRVISEEFGEALEIEERDASKLKVPLPLFVVSGFTHIALVGLPTEEMHPRIDEAIRAVLDPSTARVGQIGGVQIVGLHKYRPQSKRRTRSPSSGMVRAVEF
jgi:hypothetical protein